MTGAGDRIISTPVCKECHSKGSLILGHDTRLLCDKSLV